MRRLVSLAISLLTLLVILPISFSYGLLSGSVSTPSFGVVQIPEHRISWLHTEGAKILNANNEEVIWCGINSRGIFGSEVGGWQDLIFLDAEDIRIIREHGLNLVRVWFTLDMMVYGQTPRTPTSINYRPEFWALMDKIVDAAEQYGVWIVIDFHPWYWSPYFTNAGGFTGFPAWMYDGSWEYGAYYENSMYGMDMAIKYFFNIDDPTQDAIRQTYITMWKDIVARYKDRGHVIFSLFNEPLCHWSGKDLWEQEGQGDTEGHDWGVMYGDFMERTIDEIRALDGGSHLIIVNQAYVWYWDWNERIRRPNVVIENHLYNEGNYNKQKDYADDAWRFSQPFEFGEMGGVKSGLTSLSGTESFIQTCYTLKRNDGSLQPVGWIYLRYNPDPYLAESINPTPEIWAMLENNLYPDMKYPS